MWEYTKNQQRADRQAKAQRNAQLVALYDAGRCARTLGQQLGITKERVLQLVRRARRRARLEAEGRGPVRHEVVVRQWRPPSLNDVRGRHWSAEFRAKKKMAQLLGQAKLEARVPDITGKVRLSVHVLYTGHQQELDEDNLTGKLFRDALKQAHLIVDDSPDWLVTGEVTQTRGERTETRIVLEEVP